MSAIHNEILVRLIREPNHPTIYEVTYGREIILRLASVPSDDDIKQALQRHREQKTAPVDSDRVKQLVAKNFRHGQFPRGDGDDPLGGSAA